MSVAHLNEVVKATWARHASRALIRGLVKSGPINSSDADFTRASRDCLARDRQPCHEAIALA